MAQAQAQIQTQAPPQPDLELLPPKSHISKNPNPWMLKWAVIVNDLIIPEDVLRRYGLLLESRHGWYIHSLLKPYMKLVEWAWYGTRRRGRAYISTIYNPDGSVAFKPQNFPADSEEITKKYDETLSLWDTALKILTVPQLTINKSVGSTSADIEVPGVTNVRIRWRKTYTLIDSKDNDILNIILADPRIQQLGFTKGDYGGLISKRPVKENESADWIRSLADIVEDILAKHLHVVRTKLMAEVEAERKDIEIARQKLGISKPADQPITADDVVLLVARKAGIVLPQPSRPTQPTHEAPQTAEAEELEIVEVKPEERKELKLELPELSLEELEVVPAAATTPAAKAEAAAEAPRRQELVKIYLLAMRLPSKYLVQEFGIRETDQGFEEVRGFTSALRAQLASRLEGIRREAYEKLKRAFAYVDEFGTWIGVTDEAVKEARAVSEWIHRELESIPALKQIKAIDLSRYEVKAIPIYLEPEHAKILLDAAIRHLSEDVEELKKRIEEAQREQNRSALRRLQQDLNYKTALLEAFKKYLSQIR